MRIGIDGCCWSNYRGFGRYTREIVQALMALPPERCPHEVHLIVDKQTASAHEFPPGLRLAVAETKDQPTLAATAKSRRTVSDMLRMRQTAGRCGLDVLLYPAVYTYFPPPRGVRNVVTFHDAIAEEYPDLIFPHWSSRWAWEFKLMVAIRLADRILTVSNASIGQLERTFRIGRERMAVSGEGVAKEFRPVEDAAELARVRGAYRLPADRPIILYVGGLSPHKNLDGLLRALAGLEATHPGDWLQVLVGETEHESFYTCYRDLVTQCDELGLTERVVFTGFVSDQDLIGLYSLSTLLVMPSFSEGFGLPVAEAMACGLPVVISDRGALPETTGGAGILFDPDDDDTLTDAIRRVLEEPEMRAQHRELGLRVAAGLSWSVAAERVLSLLEEVAGVAASEEGVR